MKKIINKHGHKLLVIFLISLLFKPVWLFNNQDLGKPGNDDLSYWLHSATIVYDLDLNYQNDYQVSDGFFNKDTNTPFHPPGAGYLSAPFVFLFSLMDSQDADRLNPTGSYAYLGFFAASLFYFLTGMNLISKVAEKKKYNHSKLILFTGFIGTISHFVITRFMMAHATEFFLCAMLCYKFETKENEYNWRNFSCLSFIYLLLSFTRPSTFIYSLCLLVVYSNSKDFKIKKLSLVFINSSIFLFLHILLSNYLYSEPTIFHNLRITQEQQGFTDVSLQYIFLNSSKLFELFFSPSMGAMWVMPIIFFGIVSLIFNVKFKNNVLQTLFLFLYFYGAFVVLIVWQGREVAYGQRLLIGLIPFCMIKLAKYDTPQIFNKILGFFTTISYLGYLYFYSSSNLTLKPGITLWGSKVGYAGEDYFLRLPFEIFSVENIVAILGKTIYSVNYFHFAKLDSLIEMFGLGAYLSIEKLSEAESFSRTYADLNFGYLFVATSLVFVFSIKLTNIIFQNRKLA